MIIIGVTGGVGSGKSALLQYMKEQYSCRILMADEAAHEVSKRGGRAFAVLLDLLDKYPSGRPILGTDGEIDRAEMASRIFTRPELRDQVNALIHPAVKDLILEEILRETRKEAAGDEGAVRYCVLEAALLIECGYRPLVDEMWYIYCDPGVRAARLRAGRGYSEEKTRSIMASQLTEEEFRANSDVVIDNSGEFEDACRQADEALLRLQARADRTKQPAENAEEVS